MTTCAFVLFSINNYFDDWYPRIKARITCLEEVLPKVYQRPPQEWVCPHRQLYMVAWWLPNTAPLEDAKIGGSTAGHYVSQAPRLFFFGQSDFRTSELCAKDTARYIEYERNALWQKQPANGVGNFVLWSGACRRVDAWATQPPVVSLFYGQNRQDYLVFSNRPLLAYTASTLHRAFRPNNEYIREYLISGFSFAGTTPYPNIARLIPNRRLVLSDDRFLLQPHPLKGGEKIAPATPLEKKGQELAAVLQNAARPALRFSAPSLWLSGGKDSRTLAAVLTALGARRLQAFVLGDISGRGEAAVAKAVADACGFDFRVERQQATRDRVAAARRALQRSEGLGLTFPHQLGFDLHVKPGANLHGHGHILRGGQARTMNKNPEIVLSNLLASTFLPIVRPTHRDPYVPLFEAWKQERETGDPRDLYHYFHLDQRTGSFTNMNYIYMSSEGLMIHPLLNEAVNHFAERLLMFDKVSERVLFAALLELSPQLSQIPIYRNIWRFDRNPDLRDFPDSDHNFQDGYTERQPSDPSRIDMGEINAEINACLFDYDEPADPTYHMDKAGMARFVMDAVLWSDLRDLLEPGFTADIAHLAAHRRHSSYYASLDSNAKFHADAYLKRAFLAAAMMHVAW